MAMTWCDRTDGGMASSLGFSDWLLQLWCRALLSNGKILSIPGKDQMAI
jgi:hypothetical protein